MFKYVVIFGYLVIQYNAEAQTSVLHIADSLYALGNYSKAITAYSQHDNQSEVYDNIAKAYAAIGNLDLALANYKKSTETNPDDALLKFEYAKLLLRTKNYKAASKAFEELIYLDYRNPNYHYQMGLALERLNDSTAFNRFKSAYDLDKHHQKAIAKIAKHYLKKRQHKVSQHYINKGLETYKNNVDLISLKAQNYYYQHKFREAIKWFQKLLTLGENSDFIHEKLSLCYAEFSEYENAITHRLEVLKSNPYDATSMYVIGTYYERLNNFEKAEEYISKSLALQDKPLHQEYRQLGTIYNRQKNYEAALKAFQKALNEDPSDTFTRFFIIRTKDEYYADRDAVKKLYQEFAVHYSETPFAKFAERRIKELEEASFLKKN